MSYASLSKALLPKSLRNKKKYERVSIASIVEPSVSAAALFASATLVPSPSSYIFSQTPSPAAAEDEPTLTEAQSKRTLRRVKARIELRATPTAQMERATTSTSTATASSGSSHVPSTLASSLSSPFASADSSAWDAEEEHTSGFDELFQRFSMQEAEELHISLTPTERD